MGRVRFYFICEMHEWGKEHNGCMSRTSLQSKEKRKKERKRKYVSMCRRASVAVETGMYCIVYVCVYIYI